MSATRRLYWAIVEKRNPLALHGLFDSAERAERHLREVIPDHVARGLFMDKSLRPDDFTMRAPEA